MASTDVLRIACHEPYREGSRGLREAGRGGTLARPAGDPVDGERARLEGVCYLTAFTGNALIRTIVLDSSLYNSSASGRWNKPDSNSRNGATS
jgi:hypothetical protein